MKIGATVHSKIDFMLYTEKKKGSEIAPLGELFACP